MLAPLKRALLNSHTVPPSSITPAKPPSAPLGDGPPAPPAPNLYPLSIRYSAASLHWTYAYLFPCCCIRAICFCRFAHASLGSPAISLLDPHSSSDTVRGECPGCLSVVLVDVYLGVLVCMTAAAHRPVVAPTPPFSANAPGLQTNNWSITAQYHGRFCHCRAFWSDQSHTFLSIQFFSCRCRQRDPKYRRSNCSGLGCGDHHSDHSKRVPAKREGVEPVAGRPLVVQGNRADAKRNTSEIIQPTTALRHLRKRRSRAEGPIA